MKKKKLIPIMIAVVLIIAATIYCLVPKTFGKEINPEEVDHIDVFDGNTGAKFTVDDPDDIKYIVENIKSKTMKKAGISLGRMGYRFSVVYADSNGKAILPEFIINAEDTIRQDPFFYHCDGGLCFEYLAKLETEIGDK